MPNHVKSKIELIGSLHDIDALIKKFGTYVPAEISRTHDEKEIICTKIGDQWGVCWLNEKTGHVFSRDGIDQYGIPEGYKIEIHDARLAFPDFDKVMPSPKETPAYNDLPSQEEVRNDPNWWYNWNPKNWGTKWNSYSHERPSINIFTFETAWSPVPKIIEVISKQFPEVLINYTWADEDTGFNCGKSVFKNGLIESSIPDGGTLDAYKIAFELRPENQEYYNFIDGEYVSKEN